jgi:hypothetical protein
MLAALFTVLHKAYALAGSSELLPEMFDAAVQCLLSADLSIDNNTVAAAAGLAPCTTRWAMTPSRLGRPQQET